MSRRENVIASETFKRGTTVASAELHISGGVRAGQQASRMWGWHPVLQNGEVRQLSPMPINRIDDLAGAVGLRLFGGDEQSGIGTPLVSRVWTPLDGPGDGQMQPADLWGAIAGTAEEAGDGDYAMLARHISFSLHAAGIRLRDASDGYRLQLIAAIHERRQSGKRFSNIPMRDLQLAFHSVLSELASARDYLAAALASKLGAPAKVDAMNRFADWLGAASRAELRDRPVVRDMLTAYDASSDNPWLHQLTEYRNLFLHRQPLGSQRGSQFLRYDVIAKDGLEYPRIVMPLGDEDPSAPGKDGLTRFIELYRAMTELLKLAAANAPYESALPHFVVR